MARETMIRQLCDYEFRFSQCLSAVEFFNDVNATIHCKKNVRTLHDNLHLLKEDVLPVLIDSRCVKTICLDIYMLSLHHSIVLGASVI